MRTLGLAVLGFFCGVILGFVLTEVVARAAVGVGSAGDLSGPVIGALGALTPVCGLLGVVAGVLVGRRGGRDKDTSS
ncbi:MAG: hypothetical protein GEV10_21700 [Streptosporangiales bacterium]|nr:hypothetical protein [Streptosporangiales bacterium]